MPMRPTPSRRTTSAAWCGAWPTTLRSWTGISPNTPRGWNFARIPLVASAIMRVAMYEILYMPDIPHGASINEAVGIAKKYETPETVKFINGILGTFVRRETAE